MKKLTNEQKQEFINSNISVVPTKCIEKFNQLDIDGQYKKIREYVRKQNGKIVHVKSHTRSNRKDCKGVK